MRWGSGMVYITLLLLVVSIAFSTIHENLGEVNYFNQEPKHSRIKNSMKWISTQVVSTVSDGNSLCLDIDVDKDDNVHVVWQDPTIQVGAGSDWDGLLIAGTLYLEVTSSLLIVI